MHASPVCVVCISATLHSVRAHISTAALVSCFIPGYFQTLFTSTRALSSAPLLECLCGNVNPTLGEHRLFSPPLRPRCGESNLLTETSATIKVSPISRVMLLKGFACILEAGSGNTLGCHMCRPGMRHNGWECQEIRSPMFLRLSWITWASHSIYLF